MFALLSALFVTPAHAAFDSGSTGSDGPLAPTANVVLQIPANGIFNFTTVNIPTGVTVTFTKNASNTPVYMLATGDVNIIGTIDVSGKASLTSGIGLFGDRTAPGTGGPGGFEGGRGGLPEVNRRGGNGLGPGGGGGGYGLSDRSAGGGGAGYGALGNASYWGLYASGGGVAGTTYGSNSLVPMIGGSGGGGGAGAIGADGYVGTGGGGGGGATLIAASGTVNITGAILANGGNAGNVSGTGSPTLVSSTGGGGSGGAIRIVASNIIVSGTLNVTGGIAGTSLNNGGFTGGGGGNGGNGRISSEIVTVGTLTLTGLPTLSIASVGGQSAPTIPTGSGDVALAANFPNPVVVTFNTVGVPAGGTVTLTLTPARGDPTTATSSLLTGNLTSATASASINIPLGISTLFASTSYTLVIAMGESLSKFANGERVEKIMLSAAPGKPSKAMLVTVSGKQYPASPEALRMAAIGG